MEQMKSEEIAALDQKLVEQHLEKIEQEKTADQGETADIKPQQDQ